MGRPLDIKQRQTLTWVDDDARKHKIDVAQELIYQKKYVVNSKAVEAFLKDQSLVPTIVSNFI